MTDREPDYDRRVFSNNSIFSKPPQLSIVCGKFHKSIISVPYVKLILKPGYLLGSISGTDST